MRTTEKRKLRALPSITRAHRSAKDRSKTGSDVFVSEWADDAEGNTITADTSVSVGTLVSLIVDANSKETA